MVLSRPVCRLRRPDPGFEERNGIALGIRKQRQLTGMVETEPEFDPVFSPINSGERKQWEKIHGKRQR